jgi:hypothetical protein
VAHENIWYKKGAIARADEKLKGRDREWDRFSQRDAYQYEK